MRVESGRPVGYDPGADRPPARPASLAELPFDRQPPVRWYRPGVLAAAGLQVLMSAAFGSYLDKRELQTVLDQQPFTDLASREEVWIDFVADTGDGFDATYSVASLVGRDRLDVAGVDAPLPRADVLAFGGDLVYPDATAGGYEHRFVGPHTAALPWMPPDRRPAMFAIPGNHDWYDGLTSFLRVFGQQKAIGGWQTYQTRSYYAVQLPHRWWLWGIDVAFDAYVDEPQLRFFDGLDVQPGDRIILCTAEPSWVGTAADPAAYRNVAYVERRIIAPKGARLVLALSGDLHHYARYEADDGATQKVTAGGGGAFLHPTHGLPAALPVRTRPDDSATETTHRLAATYPSPRRSRWLALGALALPWRNPTFLLLPAVVSLLLTAQVLGALRPGAGEAADAAADAAAPVTDLLGAVTLGEVVARIVTDPVALAIVIVVLLALVAFATPPRHLSPRVVPWAKRVLGLAHTALHVAAAVLVVWVALRAASLAAPGWAASATAYAAAAVLGGVAGSLAFGLYLAVTNAGWAAEGNHAFSAQQLRDDKCFVRLRVAGDGSVTMHAIGIARAGRRWEVAREATADDDPWIRPAAGEPRPHLIEQVRLRPDHRDDARPATPPATDPP